MCAFVLCQLRANYGSFLSCCLTVLALHVISKSTSFLSICGSSMIMISIFSRNLFRKEILHQFLLGLSISDLATSITLMLAPNMVPKGSLKDAPWVFGNEITCDISAFFQKLSWTVTAFYNCFISVYFWKVIRERRRGAGKLFKR